MSLQTASASIGRLAIDRVRRPRPRARSPPPDSMPAALSSRTPVSPLALLSFSPSGLMMSG